MATRHIFLPANQDGCAKYERADFSLYSHGTIVMEGESAAIPFMKCSMATTEAGWKEAYETFHGLFGLYPNGRDKFTDGETCFYHNNPYAERGV